MKKHNQKLVVFITVIIFLLFSVNGFALDNRENVVRVGWYHSSMFQEGCSDNEIKSGYCYDYLQKIADYTNWKYEYVYGDWTDLLHQLQNGEIDFLGGISYTEERAKNIIFPETSMGNDLYYLYKKADDSSILASNLETLNGKKAGTISENLMSKHLEKWVSDNNLDLEIVYFNSFEEQEEAFKNGKLDLLIQTLNNVLSLSDIGIVAKIGEDPFYLAVSKKRNDLLTQLDDSLNTILSINPFLLQNLQYRNYGTTLVSRTLTESEIQWAKTHSKIIVGYMDNYLPFSNKDSNGKAEGLMKDVVQAIFSALNLNHVSVEYVSFTNYGKLIQSLREDKIDIAFPVGGNFWELEQEEIDASSSVVSCSETFFYKGNYDKEKIKKIAVNVNNQMQISFCKRFFPDAELCFYPTIEACLKSVLREKTDGTIINNLRSELVTGNHKYSNLSYVLLDSEDSRCFGVNQNNISLLLMLNRGLRIIGNSFGINNSYKYMGGLYSYTISDFIRHNVFIFIIFLTVVSCVVIFLLLHRLKRKERNERIMSKLNHELDEALKTAERANNAKTIFLNNMSHDIRTPMNAILGFAQLMEKNKEKPEIISDYLGKITKSGEYLLSIINNVLDMARIESGKATIEYSVMDLKNAEENAIASLEALMKQKKQTFIVTNTITHQYVLLDVAKHQEITMNLLSNAIKYTQDGGTIKMHMDELPSNIPGLAYYKMTISDNGIGMSPDFVEHIFDMFSRERNSTDSKIIGTGLGMSIVKKLVDLLGGTIEVYSEVGKGSSFVVTFIHKIIEDPEHYIQDINEEANDSDILTGKTILLAEDNDYNFEIAADILEEQGLNVERAENGFECYNKICSKEAGYYDLIFMDIQMPTMDGYEATRRIRALDDKVKANIPIIAMTANAFEEDKQKAADAGMNAHISKPIKINVVLKQLRECFEK